MEKAKTIGLRVLRPKEGWAVLFTIVSIAALYRSLAGPWQGQPVSYVVYLFSAYTLVVVSLYIVALWKKIRRLIYQNRHSNRYITDASYRTTISMTGSLIVNLFFAGYKMVTAIRYHSFWFGAMAVYYIVLCFLRMFILRHLASGDYTQRQALKAFRNCGVFLVVLNVALSGVVFQMLHQGRGYQYPGSMIYAAAAYAFYSFTMALMNTLKYRKLDTPLLTASKTINLVTALVAIFTLQTAMFAAFGNELSEKTQVIMNILTGTTVCLFILAMGILMVVRGNKRLKTEKEAN